MQTWLVHMRRPMTLLRELGLWGFITFQLAVGGSVLAALIHPLFFLWLLWAFSFGTPVFSAGDDWMLFCGTLIAGYLTTALIGWQGLAKRGLLSSAWALALVPVHWLLLSIAAWRAIYQLAFDPHRWEKTEHGLAKSSRRAGLTDGASTEANKAGPSDLRTWRAA